MAAFDDGKAAGAMRTIGEVSGALGLKPHILRYWEEQFPMLQPLKRGGNRRYYRPEDVALVSAIDRLVNREGYTIKGARHALEDGRDSLACEADGASDAITGPPDRAALVAELKAIRAQLAQAVAPSA